MTEQAASPLSYPCPACGARIEFAAGTNVLRCPYCQHEQQVAVSDRQVQEHDFAALLATQRKPVASLGKYNYACQRCAAHTESDLIAQVCQFCGSPLVADLNPADLVVPEAVLPFGLDRKAVRTALQGWVSSRWFAPTTLKKVSEAESLQGTYLPHWTYDAKTRSYYTGQRGEHYWDTETYTTTDSDGNSRTETRQVQRTAWYPTSGNVARAFDDVLVPGSTHATAQRVDELAPWPLEQAVPYQGDYLAGYQALRYDVEPEAGLDLAKQQMATVIESDCRDDIGGDEQRVSDVQTQYDAITYKLMLLPVWLVCYLHAGKQFQVMVNARTGEVIGSRPYSKIKITLAVLGGLLLIAAIVVAIVLARRH